MPRVLWALPVLSAALLVQLAWSDADRIRIDDAPSIADLVLPEAPLRPLNYGLCYDYALERWTRCDEPRLLLDRLCELLAEQDVDQRRALAELTAVITYESHGRANCRGAAGERGVLQIHPSHRRRMQRMGLDFDSEDDRLQFGVALYAERGLKPWTVRRRALRDAEELQ